MGFSPRSRATSEVPRFNSWPDDEGQPGLQGFAGYKAGMSHVVTINDEPNSPREGQEETVPVTVVETPPMRAVAVRAYEDTPYTSMSSRQNSVPAQIARICIGSS